MHEDDLLNYALLYNSNTPDSVGHGHYKFRPLAHLIKSGELTFVGALAYSGAYL